MRKKLQVRQKPDTGLFIVIAGYSNPVADKISISPSRVIILYYAKMAAGTNRPLSNEWFLLVFICIICVTYHLL